MSKNSKVVDFAPDSKQDGDFRDANEDAHQIYSDLLSDPHTKHLVNFKVRLIFTSKEMKKGTKRVLGKAVKCTARDNFLHGYDFLIILDEQIWGANPDIREPLMFHEMLHCGENDDGSPCIIEHDVEEFGAVVQKFGLWKTDLKDFSGQLDLFSKQQAQG